VATVGGGILCAKMGNAAKLAGCALGTRRKYKEFSQILKIRDITSKSPCTRG